MLLSNRFLTFDPFWQTHRLPFTANGQPRYASGPLSKPTELRVRLAPWTLVTPVVPYHELAILNQSESSP